MRLFNTLIAAVYVASTVAFSHSSNAQIYVQKLLMRMASVESVKADYDQYVFHYFHFYDILFQQFYFSLMSSKI